MHCPTSYLTRAFAIVLLLAASAPPQEPPPPKCCFTNPGYSGTCEVQPAKDESCAQILDYLNDPMSQGKGYCGNTTIRGGWKSAACKPNK